MKTQLSVLSEQEKKQVHEASLEILETVGVRVESDLARRYFAEAGAEVNQTTRVVKLPRDLVEKCLNLVPKNIVLGSRRPGWDLHLNGEDSWLVADGEASSIWEYESKTRRATNFQDWLQATRLLDVVDEVGVYWCMVEGGLGSESHTDLLRYWRHLFGNFSKHIQDPINHKDYAPWLLEVLQIVFGSKQEIIEKKPYSFLVCPQSPLIIDEQYTEALLALAGWGIPVAIMPMPLMGGTAPGTMISIMVTGNCEVLSMLCLLQVVDPGWPVIYAPVLAAMNPRTGLYSGGGIDNALLSAAAIEMGRFYNLPVEGTGGGTDHFVPRMQAAYERAMTAMMPILAWPDLLVGCGLLGGSMVLSMEQVLVDAEIFRMSKHAAMGIDTSEDKWLMKAIREIGPGGHFLGRHSTVRAIRNGEWYHPKIGHHGTFESWKLGDRSNLMDEAHALVKEMLASHEPLPLPQEVERELLHLEKQAEFEG
jgi:trimethylamine--corrinoid protein Co-methyltransferase